MKTVGMSGFTFGTALIGLALAKLLPDVFSLPAWIGWVMALCIWLAYGYVTNFAFGSWLLAFLYALHAMVGYVELGTDSWITNITKQVLKSDNDALLAFIWTNVLMFTLRFFAGPIVHRINPLGLLFGSACLGTLGLFLLGQNFTDSMWPWMMAVTVYGLGKTFYWPTLLGVVSERFPKGGALALGLSGGVGMIGVGILGAPGIGYKQDYFARKDLLSAPQGEQIYERYMARKEDGKPEDKGFPILSDLMPNQVPSIAGIDNAKLKVLKDYASEFGPDGKRKPDAKPTGLEADIKILRQQEADGKSVEPKTKENLLALEKWWEEKGKPNFETDKKPLLDAQLYGAKMALLYTAIVPAVLAVGFLLLILYFAMTGGYKQVHLDETHPPMEEY
jgi:hypothetical protein